jgi:REP element-mobilizing transposase RayT
VRMGRTRRSHLPGAAFHITARTQWRAPLFEEALRERIASYIRWGLATSDAMLLAYAVMPNHFHIVLRQGVRPLGWVMQPIMRRIALLVQRSHDIKGHIFERRFRNHICETPDHLRRVVAYTHINPLRAGLCNGSLQYPWTSHAQYVLDDDGGVSEVQVIHALRLFATSSSTSRAQLIEDYNRYLRWRIDADAAGDGDVIPPEPPAPFGDLYFNDSFTAWPITQLTRRWDLRDRAVSVLRDIEPGWSIDRVRCSYGSRRTTAVRNQLIAALLQNGYRVHQVARFMHVSDSTVSAISAALRTGLLAS